MARAATLADADLPATVSALAAHSDEYVALLSNVPDEAFRKEIEMFGNRSSVGAFIVSLVLGGAAAYRTQLFCYLKACGRAELGTMNLWAGIDPAPAQVAIRFGAAAGLRARRCGRVWSHVNRSPRRSSGVAANRQVGLVRATVQRCSPVDSGQPRRVVSSPSLHGFGFLAGVGTLVPAWRGSSVGRAYD